MPSRILVAVLLNIFDSRTQNFKTSMSGQRMSCYLILRHAQYLFNHETAMIPVRQPTHTLFHIKPGVEVLKRLLRTSYCSSKMTYAAILHARRSSFLICQKRFFMMLNLESKAWVAGIVL